MANDLQKITLSLHDALTNRWPTLEVAEDAFRKSAVLNEYSLLLNSLAAWQISSHELYKPKFATLEAYLMQSKDRLGISRAYFFERVKIAEAYTQYKDKLYAAGFREDRDASNLRLFGKAQEVHGTEAAIKKLPKLSYREYQQWIMGKLRGADVRDKVEVSEEGIRFDGELIVSARSIARIYEEGEEPFIIGVRSDAEKRAVSRYLRERRERGAGE